MRLDQVRIPTIIALFILTLGSAAGVWLVNSKPLTGLTANPTNQPAYVSVTNITDTSFTVSWATTLPTQGVIKFGTTQSSLDQTAIDDRDQQSLQANPYRTHHVTIGKTISLNPSANYYFAIQSGGTTYIDQGIPYHTTTAPVITERIPAADSISGKVIHSDGSPAAGAIIYIVLPDVSTQSTLTTSSGNWIIPLSLARSSDFSQFATYDPQTSLSQIFVQGDNGQTSSVEVSLAQARPVSTITLGQNYNWRSSPLPSASTSATLGAETIFPLQPLGSPLPAIKNVTISYPGPAEQPIPATSKLAIIGNGPPKAILNITIESSQKVIGSIEVTSDGTWEWDVPANLSPGPHTITVSYTDLQGHHEITRSFSISTTSVLAAFTASSSGLLTPTPTPTTSATPTLFPSPSPTPSPKLSPTPTTPLLITSPTPTTTSLPVSGETLPTITLTAFGSTALLLGALLLLFSKIRSSN